MATETRAGGYSEWALTAKCGLRNRRPNAPHSHGHTANYATRPLRPCAKSKPAAKQTNESVAGSGTSPAPARRLSLLIENVEFGCSKKSHSLAQVTLPGP